MGTDFDEDHRGAPPESWTEPFRKALGLRGRPDSKFKWYLVWARRFAAWLAGRPLHLATHDDAEEFLTTLASSPRISGWQVEQATDAMTILLGIVFGQGWAKAIRIPAPPPPLGRVGGRNPMRSAPSISPSMVHRHGNGGG